jgi:hypothetical protein
MAILVIALAAAMAACGGSPDGGSQSSSSSADERWLESADSATGDLNLSLRSDLTWGMSRDEVANMVGGPFASDMETYLSVNIKAAFPADEGWAGDSGSVDASAFKSTDFTAYYAFDEGGSLVEYGYQLYAPSLEQYDFLKEYYTKKYGEPKNEEYIWNDSTYEPDGTEDLYAEFKAGQVKVLTMWDLDALGSVLVIDWLSDPDDTDNDFGQISFYEKTGELTER